MIDVDRFNELARSEDWDGLTAMLDGARDTALSSDDVKREVHWRGVALERQGRYEDALNLIRDKAQLFNSKCGVQQRQAALLLKLGRDQEALSALETAPFEAEMPTFYGLALDAKFSYFHLLAQQGDPSVRERLAEIPDDYRHMTMDIESMTKADILALLPGVK
ncbi:hypothetical protein [Beijerinckia sp. L45]|uniref:hypothetical protein n=1 Tax=Beijerinckia sp. L45 TaxID=1641855 RepID=UPI00131DD794|nr:hypothetical protein [Beijerinckia sp. L45]